MRRKFNKDLFNEELKRIKILNEFDFYTGNDELSIIDEDDDELEDEELPVDDSNGDDLGIDDLPADDSNTFNDSDNEEMEDVPDLGNTDDFSDDINLDDDLTDLGDEVEAPVEDEVELDVTDLVNGTEEAKETANIVNNKMDELLSTFNTLTDKLSNMDTITQKIDNLEVELEKRAPTPEEKLEMRSLDSYPYNVKLTDFWSNQEGQYDILDNNDEEKELTLTQQDIEHDYNENSVRTSFDEFEEEEF